MDLDAIKIRVYIRKVLIFSIRTCYRSVRDHPFVWGLVFFFIFLYRFFPSVFGFLVSSSPVLISTAVLLGTLLSFGDPNIPEIEKDEKETHDKVSSLKAPVGEDDLVVQNHESFSVETHVEKREDIETKTVEEPVDVGEERDTQDNNLEKDFVLSATHEDGLISRTFVIEEEPNESPGEKQVIEEEQEFCDFEFVEKREFCVEKPLIEVVADAGEDVEDQSSESRTKEEVYKPDDEFHSIHLEDHFGSYQDLSWKPDEDHAESSDSESDRAESSSPDASMADIMPMLDELHPLLESESPQPALISLGDSDAASEHSHRSGDGSVESEEEEAQGVQEDETKDVVTWTEDDQKNLMDLGNLELERNRRLESLIARRRARKNLRMEAEMNLIDFDTNHPPFQIAPILTTRNNPFDSHYDYNESMGLPPIPGSAPSVLVPRRNPFDLPYDPLEEKPNLMEDSFQQEFMTFQQKDMHFRRYGSFNVGVSGGVQQRKHDSKFIPFFVTERMASEAAEYSTFQRQWSQKSDSKMSSVPETESVSSVADQEDHKKLFELELSQEGELISPVDHTSEHVERESQFSLGDWVEIDPEEKRDIDLVQVDIKGVDEESAYEMELKLPNSGFAASPVVPNEESEVHVAEVECSALSSPSLSEMSEKIFHVNPDEGSSNVDRTEEDFTERSSISMQPSLTKLNSNLMSQVMEGMDDNQTNEPIYDLSPSQSFKTLSNASTIQEDLSCVDKGVLTSTSSITSDMQVEIAEVGSAPVLVDTADGDTVFYNGSIEREMTSGNEGLWTATTHLCTIDENESRSREVTEISGHDGIEFGFSGVDNSDYPHVPIVPFVLETVVEQVSTGSSSSSSKSESEGKSLTGEETNLQFEQNQIPSSSFDPEVHVVHQHDADEKVGTVTTYFSDGLASEGTLSALEKSLPMENLMVLPSSDGDHEELQQESSILLEKSFEEADTITNVNELVVQEPEEDLSSISILTAIPDSISSEVSENKSTTELIDVNDDSLIGIQSEKKSSVLEKLNDSVETIGPHVTVEEFTEEAEGIKEIDEEFLLELDTVGDFSVKESGLNTNQIEEQLSAEDLHSLPMLHTLRDEPAEDIEGDSEKLSEFEALEDSLNESGIGSANCVRNDRIPEVTTLQGLKLGSLEDADLAFMQLGEGEVEKPTVVESLHIDPLLKETEVRSVKFELNNQDPYPIKTGLELPVPKAQSLEDIESTNKQLHEGVQKPIITESFHDKAAREETEAWSTESGPSDRNSNLSETNSELPVLEARSLEYIDFAFKQIHEGFQKATSTESFHDEPIREETESELSDGDSNPTETNSELPVLEARSLEDIDLALKQLLGGDVEKTILSESVDDGSAMVESQDLVEIHSELQVIEARSLEDIHLALKPLSEDNMENLQKPLESKHESAEVEVKEMDSAKIESSFEEAETRETDRSAEESSHQVKETSEYSSPSTSDIRHNKAGSTESELSDRDSDPTEINSELPVLEARSLEDTDLALKQFLGGDVEKPILSESVDRSAMVESQDLVEIHSELQVIEARSLEDIHLALKPLSEDNMENLQKPLESKHVSAEVEVKEMDSAKIESSFEEAETRENDRSAEESSHQVKETSEYSSLSTSDLRHNKEGSEFRLSQRDSNPTETNAELPVLELEARSLEDIDWALKQLHERGDAGKTILSESVDDGSALVESQDPVEFHSKLQVLEPSSLEDIHLALKPLSEDNMENLQKPLESKQASAEVKELEAGTSAEESKHEVKETSEYSSLSTSAVGHKKAGSHQSSSSSSSSSSDSE